MTQLIKYSSYVTGKRVSVLVEMSEGGSLDYSFESDANITESDQILLNEEASRQAKAALSSKILLG